MFPRIRLRYYISILFIVAIIAFAAINVAQYYVRTQSMLLADAEVLFDHIGLEIGETIGNRYDAAARTADLLAAARVTTAETIEERLRSLPLFTRAIADSFGVAAAYVGYDDGDFLLVRPNDDHVPRNMVVPPFTAFIVQSIETWSGAGLTGAFRFYDKDLNLLALTVEPEYRFDPRRRNWYSEAITTAGVSAVAPYVFFTTREVGTTLASRAPNGGAVAGVDLTLTSLSEALADARPTASADIFVFDEFRRVIVDTRGEPLLAPGRAGHNINLPHVNTPLRIALADLAATGESRGRVEIDGVTWMMAVQRVNVAGYALFTGIAAPRAELVAVSESLRDSSLIIALITLGLTIPAILLLSRWASRPVEQLTRLANEVRALRFSTPIDVSTPLSEVDDLAKAMSGVTATVRQLLSITAALTGEEDFESLLIRVLEETGRIAEARGGIIYLAEPDGSLVPAEARWAGHDLGTRMPTLLRSRDLDHPVIATLTDRHAIHGLTRDEVERHFPGIHYHESLFALTVPLRNRDAEIIGALLLLIEGEGGAHLVTPEMIGFVEAVSGTAAVSIEARRLILEQRNLFNGVITLLAGAIDTKSPYTGGHCQRVPILMEMLADAADRAEDGVFGDFRLTEAQWEELRVASWLHDCGKITSPEYVIDKATKLETIYDRLHEVRMRFEVIKREAEAACWRAVADGAGRDAELARLADIWRRLDDDFAFVATCNEGGEFMAPDRIERLRRIAERRWTRTLDDRIGLSWEERKRRDRTPAPVLPVSEPLLADRPDHVIDRPEGERLAPDNRWGFKVDVPEHLYNRGEIYNLSVARGTLTAEERYKINEHMIATIRMLTDLPLPSYLRNVPEIAGGHHEKMDGTGYPKRLTRDEMSWPARMMAVADIFEALTAGDRPYKKAKPLSAAIQIMARMRDEDHIDPDVFDLFLRAGIHESYARAFLEPDQIDAVDITAFLRPRPEAATA
ncbi:HAMP domain-containing protein [Zavarzinia compransoris]|uniref:HD domain-containing phosphohydrolase n=1 Tax=Zavarzinia marina TaxID=2911065 RepID=UPI001F3CB677|nr:HD domain-containing phosphohydrolase [Zavarzinia marina]MCF4166208.1 HAMP domain-containing protein [Zavarzinia marina]